MPQLRILSPLLLLLSPAAAHKCVHTEFVSATLGQAITGPPSPDAGASAPHRSLLSGPLSSLRITPIYIDSAMPITSAFTSTLKNWLKATLVPTAVSTWQGLLTLPQSPSLFAHRDCAYVWSNTATLQCSQYAAKTYCARGFDEIDIDLTPYLGADVLYNSGNGPTQTLPATGSGVPNSDFALFVTATDTSVCQGAGGSDVLAYAQNCQRDGATDRPTFGRINFCPTALSMSADVWHDQLSVALHEMAHALGFTDSSFPLFRAPDGTPRTARSSYDPTQPADAFLVAYTCGNHNYVYAAADPSTIAFLPERGTPCVSGATVAKSFLPFVDGATHKADCVQRFVSPAMAAAAQGYYGCSNLVGPEVDHLDGDCALYGSHWEGRTLLQELMAPYISHWPIVGPVTLAFFADSGW